MWGSLGSVGHYPGYPWESLLLTIQWVELGTGDGMEYWTGPVHKPVGPLEVDGDRSDQALW